MAFPRRVLVEGEELVLELRPHPIALARAVIVSILVLVAWILIVPRVPLEGTVHSLLVWAVWIVGIVLLVWFGVRDVVGWATSYFVVTSDRVIHRQGLIAKRSMEIPLEAINDVRFEQGVFERMIGAGSLILESASEAGREVFSYIRDPEEVQKTIYRMSESNQQRMMSGAGAGSAKASVADELRNLGELRASGVITEAEFQTQKRKLLG